MKYTEIYFKPYYRFAPYLVGIACADIYMCTKDKVKNMKATWWKVSWLGEKQLSLCDNVCSSVLSHHTKHPTTPYHHPTPNRVELFDLYFSSKLDACNPVACLI